MKAHYKVQLTPNPVIVRVTGDIEEVIYDKYLKISTAERIRDDLNKGYAIDWDDLN